MADLPPEPPNLTALFWPEAESGNLAIRYDTDAPAREPERRWYQPNNSSMRALTWPEMVEWLAVCERPIDKAIRLRSRRKA